MTLQRRCGAGRAHAGACARRAKFGTYSYFLPFTSYFLFQKLTLTSYSYFFFFSKQLFVVVVDVVVAVVVVLSGCLPGGGGGGGGGGRDCCRRWATSTHRISPTQHGHLQHWASWMHSCSWRW